MLWHEPDTQRQVLKHMHGLELPSPEVGIWELIFLKSTDLEDSVMVT